MSQARTEAGKTPLPPSVEVLLRLLDKAPIGFVIWRLGDPSDDASLELVFANSGAERFLDQTLGTKLGMRFSELFPTVPVERRKMYADVVRKDAPLRTMVESDVSGRKETYSLVAEPLGEGCVGISFENLDAQRRAEEAALEANRFLDSIIEYLPNMVFVKDAAELRFVRFNKAGEELLGLSRDALLGKSDYDFFPAEQADFFIAADRETLQSGAIKDIPEEPIQTGSGQRWLHTKKVPIWAPTGEPKYLLGISQDITARRRADAELRAAKEAVETANRELEAFSYSVAHDLRQPLRAIDGFSQALAEDHAAGLPQEARDYLQRIRRAARRMGELIDDLLKLSQVTRAEIVRSRVNVTEMVAAIVSNLKAAQTAREVTVKMQPGLTASADARLLRIALENLLANAFKFTSRKEHANIEFGAEQDDGELALFVRDDGVGFDMAHARKLFNAFERLHPNDFEGTGIGLAIVNRIAQKHGGRVWAESAVDRGATFYFTIGGEK